MFVSVDLRHDDVSVAVEEVDVGVVVGGVEERNNCISLKVTGRRVSSNYNL